MVKKIPPMSGMCYKLWMNDDQMIRAALTGASIPIYAWLIQKARTYLAAERAKHGAGLPYRFGNLLGKIGARIHQQAKGFLRRLSV